MKLIGEQPRLRDKYKSSHRKLITCEFCGEEAIVGHPSGKYCSVKCRSFAGKVQNAIRLLKSLDYQIIKP